MDTGIIHLCEGLSDLKITLFFHIIFPSPSWTSSSIILQNVAKNYSFLVLYTTLDDICLQLKFARRVYFKWYLPDPPWHNWQFAYCHKPRGIYSNKTGWKSRSMARLRDHAISLPVSPDCSLTQFHRVYTSRGEFLFHIRLVSMRRNFYQTLLASCPTF